MACEKRGCRSDRSIGGAALQRGRSEFGLVPHVSGLSERRFKDGCVLFDAATADADARDPLALAGKRCSTAH